MILVYFFPLEARMWTVTGIVLLMFLSSNFMLVFKKIFIARYLLYNIVLVSAIHQHESATGIYVPCLLNLLPISHPIPPLLGVTELRVELSVSHSKSLWVIYFTCGNVHISMLLSQFIPSPPSHTVFTSLFSVSIAALKISSMGCLFLVALLSEG